MLKVETNKTKRMFKFQELLVWIKQLLDIKNIKTILLFSVNQKNKAQSTLAMRITKLLKVKVNLGIERDLINQHQRIIHRVKCQLVKINKIHPLFKRVLIQTDLGPMIVLQLFQIGMVMK